MPKIHPVKFAPQIFNGVKKWPTGKQWLRFLKVLTKREKIAFLFFFVLALGSSIFLCSDFYLKNTEIVPTQGEIHIEGVIGQPRFINPVLANSDVDRDLVQLIFSGLMKYDQNLNLVPDLARDYPEIEEEGKVYKFQLKENLFWPDKTPLTVNDIIFTIKTIQNPDFKSPLQANWVGLEMEKIDDWTIKFILKKPYGPFLENCVLKILPKHLWQNVPAENFAFQDYNLEPTGSGPYRIKKIKQNGNNQTTSLTLVPNDSYYGKKPYISEIKFLFFDNEESLLKAAEQNKISGFAPGSELNLKNWQSYQIALPRYFGLFFNQEKSKVLAEKEVRLALNYGTNKKEISQKTADSPVLPEIYGFAAPAETYQFDLEKAKEILEKAGYKDSDGDGVREKVIKKEPAFQFKSQLAIGSKGKEVEELQKCLGVETTAYFGTKTKAAVVEFQKKYEIEAIGMVGKQTRAKLNEVCFGEPEETLTLKFTITTVDQVEMLKTAEILKEQWKMLGAEVEIEKYPLSALEQNFIKPRNYQSLLFGEALAAIPDPFPFWHSSQKNDPGLNLALYQNSKADKLLEESRKSSDPLERAEKLVQFQDILIEDLPCLFLYSPDYLYLLSSKIKGVEINKIVDPSKRFIAIENWYIKTKRTWK